MPRRAISFRKDTSRADEATARLQDWPRRYESSATPRTGLYERLDSALMGVPNCTLLPARPSLRSGPRR